EALFFRGGHRSGGDLRRDRTHRIDSILHESFLLRFLFGNGSTSVGPCARSLGDRDSGDWFPADRPDGSLRKRKNPGSRNSGGLGGDPLRKERDDSEDRDLETS